MSVIKQILINPENTDEIIKTEVETSDWFERDYLHPQMLGTAIGELKSMANNMNEANKELREMLDAYKFDPTQEYMIGKAIKLLSWEL